MTILITRSRHDKETNYLYYWANEVVKVINRRKTFKLLDLSDNKATKHTLTQYLRKFTPTLLFLNGHGSEDSVFGNEDSPLLSSEDDLDLFKNSIFYCLSCRSAVILGPELIKRETKTFIGYNRDFAFAYTPRYLTNPTKDPLAKLFLEPSNLVPISLIKGNSTGEAFDKSQTAMRKNFVKMISTKASDEEKYFSWVLWSNIKGQTILGDKNATL